MATRRPPLTPQSAEITTATVEIKAMTVSGKQVTQAVFRQLYDEPLYNSLTWRAFGTPWCRINYHPDRCANDDIVHEHVVWQKDDELRRTRVNLPSVELDAVPRFDKQPDDEVAICVAAGTISNAGITSVKGATSYTRQSATEEPAAYVTATYDDDHQVKAKLYLSSRRVASIVENYGGQPNPSIVGEHKQLHPNGEGCARVVEILSQRLTQTDTWLDRAQERWHEIRQLPQVFIAL